MIQFQHILSEGQNYERLNRDVLCEYFYSILCVQL